VVPAAARFLLSVAGGPYYLRGDMGALHFMGQSEGLDALDRAGGRHLLCVFAWNDFSHHRYFVDLFDTSDRPRVWESSGSRTADGVKIVVSTPLITWLRGLKKTRR